MGKSKSRIFRKGINDQLPTISRVDAIIQASKNLNNGNIKEAKRYIAIFNINAEELLENGASYESVVSIKSILNND